MLAFTTESYPAAERFDAFIEEVGRRVMGLDAMPNSEVPFEGSVHVQKVGPLAVVELTTTTLEADRHRADDDSFVLGIQKRGRMVVEQAGVVSDSFNDFASLSPALVPGHARFFGTGLALRIPQAMLAPYRLAGRAHKPASIRRDTPLARLLDAYVSAASEVGPDAPDVVGATALRHIAELVALALGSREAVFADGIRAARRRAIHDLIARSFTAPGFSAAAAARQLGISPRYLRQLLEEDGAPFTALVMTHRLQQARQMLTDTAHCHVRITDIAYDCGFADLSYFNRVFRARFDATPSDVRAAAFSEV